MRMMLLYGRWLLLPALLALVWVLMRVVRRVLTEPEEHVSDAWARSARYGKDGYDR